MATSNVMDILASTDAEGETAAPDDEEDTGAPEDEEEETASAELEAEDADTGDINALRKRGRTSITLDEARQLQARARARGKIVERRKAKVKAKARPRMPANMVPPNSGARQILERWSARKDPFAVRQDGHYYSITEIPCKCLGTTTRAWLHIPAGEYKLFDRAVGDEVKFLGNTATATTNWTNLQRPSKNTYNEQEFLIQSITMQEAGLRVRYDSGEIEKIAGLSEAKAVLTGQSWLWDDAGMFLPKEIFHDTTGENLLYRSVRRSAVVYFHWDKTRTGGNANTRKILIDHLRNVPDTKVRTLSRTSGGAPVLPVPDGYIFTDNPERSEHGAFSAIVHIPEDIVFPVKPIDLGAGTPTKPLEVGLYLQLSLNGIAFEAKPSS
ncbi:hypothetical protein [Polyangium sp. 15x6]|uniref:hypothetical protein n=1 Tax=Polyangium sp. 15x6 TaxID=3042687 RepID=UPI00249BF615|nr:hypothetical protein [Polyangium sp. 15x6]MDI3291911.1 hypothetical protein [Polyangium sp. 15x6]